MGNRITKESMEFIAGEIMEEVIYELLKKWSFEQGAGRDDNVGRPDLSRQGK